eukprot:CAMPEP_0205812990 /NCGR_PEP_ID=MMETSP0205-20121125/17623_1 /ASSEMBLY_ACC=CAM_ASM_000278 /TAXON_ID=36767 /ORGANISM="Euplotes focardii, Strain TN1" /LENGTH=216 /DNA_ID=CAMNT_0053094579 /DNA_START=385 /DNA_END=1031 /DNA_ORIENTATION=+
MAGEYRLRNSTSVKTRINRVFQNPEQPHNELSFSIREQLSEEFTMEMCFMTGLYDEFRITGLSNVNILGNSSDHSAIEVEAKIRHHIVNATLRLKNSVGEYFGTNLEVSAGAAATIPIVGIYSDISINMFQLQKIFRRFKNSNLEKKSSRTKNINLIFGLSYNSDGLGFHIGIDLLGLTLRLPIVLSKNNLTAEDLDTPNDIDTTDLILGGIIIAS